MSATWREDICHDCGGHGVVSDYGDGEDFYGPKECNTCDGSGRLFVSPSGRLAVYPGGPFRGREPLERDAPEPIPLVRDAA